MVYPSAHDIPSPAAVSVLCTPLFAQPSREPAYDIVIHGGRIMDGTGNPWYVGDIAITDGRIVAVGKIPGGVAKRVIEANGMVVAPGFIDMLGQSETALLIDNRSISKLAQGITSEITGEGGSIAPQTALTIAAAQPSLDPYHLKIDWATIR